MQATLAVQKAAKSVVTLQLTQVVTKLYVMV